MVQINEVVPSRFREGDLISIHGFGFAPTFGNNFVAIDGIPTSLWWESATELQLYVPAGIQRDAYVPVYVFRDDTLENDSSQAWSKAALDSLRDGSSQPPGQVPGQEERADPARVEDTPQAQDYERMATAMQHLLRSVLTTKGDLFASDGTGLVPHPVGGVAGRRLGANPATGTGLEYAAIARAMTLSWGGKKLVGDTSTGSLTANGWSGDSLTFYGDHLAPLTGSLYRIAVLFKGAAGDTLNQVVIRVGGLIVHNSGAIAVPSGSSYVASLALPVVGGTSSINVEVSKGGTNGDGYMNALIGIG